jgi:hypothetical protein
VSSVICIVLSLLRILLIEVWRTTTSNHRLQLLRVTQTPTLAYKHCSCKGTITVYASPASNCVSLTYIHGPLGIQSKRSRILYHIDSYTDARELWPAHKMREMTCWKSSEYAATRGSLCTGETRASRIRFFIFTYVHNVSGDTMWIIP